MDVGRLESVQLDKCAKKQMDNQSAPHGYYYGSTK